MRKPLYYAVGLALMLGIATGANAQNDTDTDPYSLTLEELMNIPINSASKKNETLFDAPLSSYTITRADILQSGATSIMEALRMAPGVIVREQTNGNYDIHIRGFDNVLPMGSSIEKNSLATLVMIDNRPVFNHNMGGTAWETLPIDINDVERIEIVRGPSAPLFGPNAVNGVINIITKKVDNDKHAYATVQYGNQGMLIGQASYGKRLNKKLSIQGSFNFTNKERFQREYFNGLTQSYEDFASSEIHNKRFPNMERAVQKWGANASVMYAPTEKIDLDLTIGMNRSDAQKIFIGTMNVPLTTNIFEGQYVNLAAKLYGFALRSSFMSGYDQLNVGALPNGTDYKNFDIVVEHPFTVVKDIVITPGIAYQNVSVSDEGHTVPGDLTTGFLNGAYAINTSAAFVRMDAKLAKDWRFLAAVRADHFSSSGNTTVAYEFASTYQIAQSHLVRVAVTRSNAGAFIGQSYANYVQEFAPGMFMHSTGNTDYELLTVNMAEIGYRVKIHKSFQIDLDVFRQTGSNFGSYLMTEFAAPPMPPGIPTKIQFQNVPTKAEQIGATLSLNLVPTEKLQIKPFITVQKTETTDVPDAHISPDVMPGTYYSGKHKNTPGFYGGYFANYKINSRVYVNLNGYYFSSHTQYDMSDPSGGSEYADIRGKLHMNLKVNYSPKKNINIFVNGRNLLDADSREMFGTDRTGALYSGGVSYVLN
jgi:iron complex outermembrane recepter protein